MMQIDGGEKVKTLSEFYNLRDRVKKVRAAGWLHFETGSDGEPLLVGARRIGKTCFFKTG